MGIMLESKVRKNQMMLVDNILLFIIRFHFFFFFFPQGSYKSELCGEGLVDVKWYTDIRFS